MYSIGDLTSPALYSTYSTYDALDVEVQGDVAYIAAGADGLVVLDVSDRANPALLDQYDPGTCKYTSVDVEGIHCYVTNDVSPDKGIHVFDVSDPEKVAHIEYDGWSRGLDIYAHGDVALFADATYGFYLLNISNPWNIPYLIDSNTTHPDNCSTVVAQGHYAYVGGHGISGTNGLFVYNLNDMSNIHFTDRVGSDDLEDVAVCGDYMAIANGQYGVYLKNITDPWDITHLDWYNLPGHTTGVEFFGNYILVAERGSGFYIMNASNPYDMTVHSSYTTGSPDCLSIDCDGDFAYVACRDKLMIFRVFNSVGDTWDTTTRYAQSLEVDTTDRTIENATLTYAIGVDPHTSGAIVSWQLSADGGFNWESVVGGSPHTFTNQGHKLLWRATLSSSYNDRVPYISWVDIDYDYNDLPSTPALTDPGTTDTDGDITVSWSACTDDGGAPTYLLQMSDSSGFTTILDSWTPTTTSQAVTGLTNDTYYFRVRAVDDDGEYGAWSNTEDIVVAIPPTPTTPTPTPTPPIPGFPLVAVIIGASSALATILVLRRRNPRKH
jgi:hypothetical protein